ncbi:SDR family NAD(P)-dependent oxidoreductase [Henriciella aquimarina]|uniref:SDR family NAD(P)-dependent oxidoreductase n=1 Tax=Henriciella aquimarina TaxID=545261 RepID=UPI000A0119A8|nr:SDR family NAD(P)-dependent oxidoreductase [Henriciella aquimarina]
MEPYQELSRSIAGKTALITGAASGMGRATAHLFAREGANVAVTDLDPEAVEAVVQEIKDAGITHVRGWTMDVSDPDTIKRVIDETAAHFGGLEILVNNAGFAMLADLGEEGYEDSWDKSLNVMLSSHQRAAAAALPHMRKAGWGRIVNVSSTEGLGATPHNSPYAAAKHGVIGLTRGLAVDLGRENITVNCICPGPIRTGITDAIPDEHKEIFAKRRVPLRRYGIPEEVANITLSVVLPAASFLNGVHIPVDGGLTIKNA